MTCRLLICVMLCSIAAQAQQPTPPACDNACLASAIERLEQRVAAQNQLLAALLAPPPPPAHPKVARLMKVVGVAGSFATVALPIIVKTVGARKVVAARK